MKTRVQILNIAIVALISAGTATAQPSRGDSLAAMGLHVAPPMSTAEIMAVRARVDAALIHDKATGIFENATDENGGRIRHLRSGLTCPLGGLRQSLLVRSPDDIECFNRSGNTEFTTHVFLAPSGSTMESVSQEVLAAVSHEDRFALYKGAAIEWRRNPGSRLPDHRTIRFISHHGDRVRISGALGDNMFFTQLQVGLIDGWVLTKRTTSPIPPSSTLGAEDILSEAAFGVEMQKSGEQ